MEFISFAPDYWDGPRHNRHYFSLELAKHHKVLFVSPPFSVEKILTSRRQGPLARSGTQKISETLWTHVPSKLLFTNLRFPWLDRFFRRLRVRLLKRTMSRLGFASPVLLIWHPMYLEMIDAFPGRPSIYYVYDHLSGYAGSSKDQRSGREIELLRRADLVFVLSQKLLEENRAHARDIVLLPNAVDFEHFVRARDPATIVPDDIAAIARPRIGYVGSINQKVDIEMLAEMAVRRPDWSIVLIGRQNFDSPAARSRFDQLMEMPNVHWLPYKAPEQLPGYLKGIDVCLMCYVINGWTYYGDPSKMHEYLATGKPTVGTALPSILEHRDVVQIAGTHDEWIDAVAHCLAETGDELATRRIAVARKNSYAERVSTALAEIATRFGSRPA